ncbi:YceI family protein [Legionella massiliensis]|uniref:YceI family protein n=1 Tax=Legionella massiliensis TaxID=1034943 RepID=UPI003CCBE419
MVKATKLLIASFLLLSGSLYAEPVKYTLDPSHSYLLWRIEHLGFSTQAGKWYASGELVFDQEKPENSKVSSTINIVNVVTGIPELDKHLQGPLFFDSAKYPTATFVSDKVEVLSKTKAKVHGTLTLRGVSKPVVLDVTFNKAGKNPITDKDAVGFSATGEIKRSDFGLKALLPDLGDNVKLDIEAEAFKS